MHFFISFIFVYIGVSLPCYYIYFKLYSNFSSDWPTQSSESESGESSELYSLHENRSRPVPRPNARVAPTGQSKKTLTNNRVTSLSGTRRNYRDSDEERGRMSNRKATGNIW